MTRSLFRPDPAATRKELRLGGRDADLGGLDRRPNHRLVPERGDREPWRSAVVSLVAGTGLTLVFLCGAASAAVDYPGVYKGDQCGKVYSAFGINWSVSWNGAKACIEQGYLAPGLFFNITPLAYDAKKNGHSALNDWRVLQFQGLTWQLYKRGTCIISAGYGWSKVCDEERIDRLPNASRVAIQIRACNYEAPTSERVDCSGYVTRSNRAWSQIP